MAIDVSVKFDRDSRLKLSRLVHPGFWRRLEAHAINMAAEDTREFGVSLVAKQMGVTQQSIKKRLASRATGAVGAISQGRRASVERLVTSVGFRGKPFNLTRFGANNVYGNISYKRRDGKVITRKNSIIGVEHKAYNRRQLAFGLFKIEKQGAKFSGQPVMKVLPGRTRTGKQRIKGAWGPGVAWVAEQAENAKLLKAYALRRAQARFIQTVQYEYRRRPTSSTAGRVRALDRI